MSPFLAWGDFHAPSRLARSTIREEKWGTIHSQQGFAKHQLVVLTGIDFASFGLESGMVFEETTTTSASWYSSFQFQISKKERVISEFEMDFKKSFRWRSNLGNDQT